MIFPLQLPAVGGFPLRVFLTLKSSIMLPEIIISANMTLPDNDLWRFRFEINSETSNRKYTIAQHKVKKHWGCSCPGWRAHRNCKHLQAMRLPGKETPFEVSFKIQ